MRALILATLTATALSGCAGLGVEQTAEKLTDGLFNAFNSAEEIVSEQFSRGIDLKSQDSSTREKVKELCEMDGGLYVHKSIPSESGAVVFTPSATKPSQYPGVEEPVGTINGQYELWQEVQLLTTDKSVIRRTKTSIKIRHSEEVLGQAINYIASNTDGSYKGGVQCGTITVEQLGKAVFKPSSNN